MRTNRLKRTSNYYIVVCPPVRGDNPRALTSGLSPVHGDNHGITFYTTYISVGLAHYEIFRANSGMGDMNLILTHLAYRVNAKNVIYPVLNARGKRALADVICYCKMTSVMAFDGVTSF